jgi:hypothetical protein
LHDTSPSTLLTPFISFYLDKYDSVMQGHERDNYFNDVLLENHLPYI